jgi:PAS domain S-box-containing protein
MLTLKDIIGNLGDFVSDSVLITTAEPLEAPGPEIVWCNRAFTEMTGYTLDELRGKSPRILQGEDTDPETRWAMGRSLRRWEPVHVEVKNYKKRGEPFWSDIRITPVADESGWFRYWVAIHHDVTRRKEDELALRSRFEIVKAASERLKCERAELEGVAAIAEHTSDMITITDMDFRIQWANPAFLRRNGVALSDILGLSYCEVVNKHSILFNSQEAARRAVIDGALTVEETLNATIDGEPYWTRLDVHVRRNERGSPTGLILFEHDVTEARAMREELRAHRDDLRRLVDERTETVRRQADILQRSLDQQRKLNEQQIQFVRMASHELRTPMSVIAVAVRQLRRRTKEAGDEVAERLTLIDQSVDRLGKLVDGTLFLARVDAGTFAFEPKEMDLLAFLESRLPAWRDAAQTHEIRFRNACRGPCVVRCDAALLDHVFENLVGNARKYSPEADRIDISVHCDAELVRVRVRDYGLGVSAEDLPKLGQRYFRAATAQGVAGTGIGLAVVREFVDLHGGRLFIDSVEGEGSTFSVVFPLVRDGADDPEPTPEEEETAA